MVSPLTSLLLLNIVSLDATLPTVMAADCLILTVLDFPPGATRSGHVHDVYDELHANMAFKEEEEGNLVEEAALGNFQPPPRTPLSMRHLICQVMRGELGRLCGRLNGKTW
jgi:hypothetical protein